MCPSESESQVPNQTALTCLSSSIFLKYLHFFTTGIPLLSYTPIHPNSGAPLRLTMKWSSTKNFRKMLIEVVNAATADVVKDCPTTWYA